MILYFTFEIILGNIGDVNILPSFIYGLLLFYSVLSLTNNNKNRLLLTIATSVFVVANVASIFLTLRFFKKFNYIYLIFSSVAREAYLPVKILSVFETLAALFMLYISAVIFIDFIKNNDVISSQNELSDAMPKSHKALIIKSIVLFSWSGLISVVKCINIFLKGNTKIAFSQVTSEGFATGTLPWVSTLVFFLCVIFVVYSIYFISEIKNEIRFKNPK